MKYLWRVFSRISVLLILFLISLYAFSPLVLKTALPYFTPKNIQVDHIQFSRPTSTGITISDLSAQIQNKQGQLKDLKINSAEIAIDWFTGKISNITIKDLSATFHLLPLKHSTKTDQSFSPNNFLNQLIPITVDNFSLSVTDGKMQEFQLKGQLNSMNDEYIGQLILKHNNDHIGKTDLKLTKNRQLSLNLAITLSENKYLNLLHALPSLAITEVLKNNYFSFDDLQLTSNAIFDLHEKGANHLPASSNVKIVFSNINSAHDDLLISNASSEILLTQNNSKSSLEFRFDSPNIQVSTNSTDVISPNIPLSIESSTYFSLDSALTAQTQIVANTKIKFTEKNIALVRSNINIIDNKIDLNHSMQIDFHSPQQLLNSNNTQTKIDSLKGRVAFRSQRIDDQWTHTIPEKSLLSVSGINIPQYDITMENATISIQWSSVFFGIMKSFQQASITLDTVSSSDKYLALFGKQNVTLAASNQVENIRFKGYSKNESDSPSMIFVNNQFEGNFSKKSNAITGQLSTQLHSSQAKSLFTQLLPSNTKLISTLNIYSKKLGSAINNQETQADQFGIAGHVNFRYDTSLYLNGSLNSEIESIKLQKNTLKNIDTTIKWGADKKQVPWNRFNVSILAQSNFFKNDEQAHRFSTDALIDESILLKNPTLKSTLLDGTLVLMGSRDFNSFHSQKGDLVLDNINLQKVGSTLNQENFTLSGTLNGTVPFEIVDRQLHFKNGHLESKAGHFSYLPTGEKKSLTKNNINDLANITLQNFNYSVLNAEVKKGGPCQFDIAFKIRGMNPDLGSKVEQILNIGYQPKSNVNLYWLALLGEDFIKKSTTTTDSSACINP